MDEIATFSLLDKGKYELQKEVLAEIERWGKCHIEIIFRKKKIVLSRAQQNYYFGYICIEVRNKMSELIMRLSLPPEFEWVRSLVLSQTKDSVHKFLKDIGIEDIIVDEDTGEVIQNKKSTKRMSKDEFSEFIEIVAQFCATHLELVLLPPNTQTGIDLDFERANLKGQ
jgi:16S rRNA C967 or C1407 C5-methylase (RsmB/RsmF family)